MATYPIREGEKAIPVVQTDSSGNVGSVLSATNGVAVTPSDGTPLSTTTRGVYVGGAGDLTVIMSGGTTLTFSNVPAGTLLPIQVNTIKATATTATTIVAIW